MARKKTETDIAKYWAAYQEHPSGYYVAKKCGVSELTIRRYAKKERWAERLKKIREKAAQKADANAATRLAENLRILTAAKKVYATSLYGKAEIICPYCSHRFIHPVPKAEPRFRDLDVLLRLEEFLMGRPDSRPAIDDKYASLSDEELLERLKALQAINLLLPADTERV